MSRLRAHLRTLLNPGRSNRAVDGCWRPSTGKGCVFDRGGRAFESYDHSLGLRVVVSPGQWGVDLSKPPSCASSFGAAGWDGFLGLHGRRRKNGGNPFVRGRPACGHCHTVREGTGASIVLGLVSTEGAPAGDPASIRSALGGLPFPGDVRFEASERRWCTGFMASGTGNQRQAGRVQYPGLIPGSLNCL